MVFLEEKRMKKFILITGATGGIGTAISKILAEEGYSLYLHYHNNQEGMKQLLQTVEPFGGEYIPIQADLRLDCGRTKLCQEIYSLDGIVHNGGTSFTKPLTNMLSEEMEELISLHLTAPMVITKNLLPKLLQKRKGSILFISSIWGETGASNETVYSAVKGGQIAFSKALSKELAPNGIRVNAIAPGAIETKMLSHLSDEERESLMEDIPLGRFGYPMEVAKAVKFLLSEDASYITGEVLNVNGGWYT